jgi:hypothetical protein
MSEVYQTALLKDIEANKKKDEEKKNEEVEKLKEIVEKEIHDIQASKKLESTLGIEIETKKSRIVELK